METRNLKDVIHLYLGCECYILSEHKIATLYRVSFIGVSVIHSNNSIEPLMVSEIKPILRPLSDMTEEEKLAIGFDAFKVFRNDKAIPSGERGMMWAASQVYFLLSKHFDIFNLIPEGLAIDKTKL